MAFSAFRRLLFIIILLSVSIYKVKCQTLAVVLMFQYEISYMKHKTSDGRVYEPVSGVK